MNNKNETNLTCIMITFYMFYCYSVKMTLLATFLSASLGLSLLQRILMLWGVFLLFLTCRSIYRLFISPLARFPGPFWARTTNLWHMKVILAGREHIALYELHARYGPVVRIGPSKLYDAQLP